MLYKFYITEKEKMAINLNWLCHFFYAIKYIYIIVNT